MINVKGINYLIKMRKKDIYTYKHLIRLKRIIKLFAKQKKLSKKEIKCLEYAAIYHDAGKFFIENNILTKCTKLNEEEFNLMKEHTKKGLFFLPIVPKKYKNQIKDSMLNHHYVNGYFENKNPNYLTKIITIFDIYEAMTAKRPYKKSFTTKESLDLIKNIYKNRKEDYYIYNDFKNFINSNKKIK